MTDTMFHLHTVVGNDSGKYVIGGEFHTVTEFGSARNAWESAIDLLRNNVRPDVDPEHHGVLDHIDSVIRTM
jgi:hypothetical protein